jgi:hypothetical protein
MTVGGAVTNLLSGDATVSGRHRSAGAGVVFDLERLRIGADLTSISTRGSFGAVGATINVWPAVLLRAGMSALESQRSVGVTIDDFAFTGYTSPGQAFRFLFAVRKPLQ